MSPGFRWIHPHGRLACLASDTNAFQWVSWVSQLHSRSHRLFLQNSYCRGVQCLCFSMDDKYVYAGLKDRSIIVWSVLDGESFCFRGKTELRSGEGNLVLGSGCCRALPWPSQAGRARERCLQVKGTGPPWSYISSSRPMLWVPGTLKHSPHLGWCPLQGLESPLPQAHPLKGGLSSLV